MFCTAILECNQPPAIMGDKGEAARERICVLNFPMTFTDNKEKLKANPDTYRPVDVHLKGTSFKEAHYCALFKFLTTTDLLSEVPLEVVYISEESRTRAGLYLDDNDFMPSWVTENYTKRDYKLDSEPPTEFISIKVLYADFKKSDKFTYLTKAEMRNYSEAKFKDAIAKSNAYKSLFRSAKQVKIKGVYNQKDGLVNVIKTEDLDARPRARTTSPASSSASTSSLATATGIKRARPVA